MVSHSCYFSTFDRGKIPGCYKIFISKFWYLKSVVGKPHPSIGKTWNTKTCLIKRQWSKFVKKNFWSIKFNHSGQEKNQHLIKLKLFPYLKIKIHSSGNFSFFMVTSLLPNHISEHFYLPWTPKIRSSEHGRGKNMWNRVSNPIEYQSIWLIFDWIW